jgi:hypothetical protein
LFFNPFIWTLRQSWKGRDEDHFPHGKEASWTGKRKNSGRKGVRSLGCCARENPQITHELPLALFLTTGDQWVAAWRSLSASYS